MNGVEWQVSFPSLPPAGLQTPTPIGGGEYVQKQEKHDLQQDNHVLEDAQSLEGPLPSLDRCTMHSKQADTRHMTLMQCSLCMAAFTTSACCLNPSSGVWMMAPAA